MDVTRRGFAQLGAGLAGATALSGKAGFAQTAGAPPHFLLEILLRPGWDPSYLFDARPLAMTTAGIAHNYLGEEPTELTDKRGGRTLVTSLFAPLAPHFAAGRFSILNGVHMAATFDGHDQNLNFALSGNPFGGEAQLPHLNEGATAAPLDYLQIGQLFGAVITNSGRGVPLDARGAAALVTSIGTLPPIDGRSPGVSYMMQRFAAAGSGSGAFARGARAMATGLTGAAGLAERLRQIHIDVPPAGNDVPLPVTLGYLRAFFAAGIARSALIELDRGLDTHDVRSAQTQPALYKTLAEDLAAVLEFLRATPLSDSDPTPLLERTTLLVTSEFGRTLRQPGVPIDATGTDHNPLGNTVLLGGCGINGGLIIGATDQEALQAPVSDAHKSLDGELLKKMGKPFDFDQMAPTSALPPVYAPADYLTYGSVANSIYGIFGADPAHDWTLGRNLPVARPLGPVLIAAGRGRRFCCAREERHTIPQPVK